MIYNPLNHPPAVLAEATMGLSTLHDEMERYLREFRAEVEHSGMVQGSCTFALALRMREEMGLLDVDTLRGLFTAALAELAVAHEGGLQR